MKVFIAGSTGAVGKSLVPLLVQQGHEVTALVRSREKAQEVEAQGARPAIADALDREALTAAVVESGPEVVMHELTALAHLSGNFRKFDQEFALTNRFRTEVTDTLFAAARQAGARRFIAQSYCGWPFAREGGPVKDEDAPLDPHPPASFRRTLAAIRYLEDRVRTATDLEALALRYGSLYGPGTGIARGALLPELILQRKFPVVGNGAGIWSFIHIADVATATAAAMSRGDPGIYNVVDDEPAPVSSWLPFLAEVLGAKPPRHVPAWLARLLIGEGGVSMMTLSRGGSNAKARKATGLAARLRQLASRVRGRTWLTMDFDSETRLAVYRHFAETGNRPSVEDVAARVRADVPAVLAAYARLAARRVLVLEPDGSSIRMAPPFSGVPTHHAVVCNGTQYFANCAWDALGVPAALRQPAEVRSRCEQSGEPLRLQVGPDGPEPSSWLFHCLLPASQWWDDIGFT